MKRLVQWRRLLKEGNLGRMKNLANHYSTCAVGEKLGLGPALALDEIDEHIPMWNWEAKEATEATGLTGIGQQFYHYVSLGQFDKALEILREIEKS